MARGEETSTPLDFKYNGQFTSPMLLKDSDENILPITLSFIGPVRSQAIVQIYAQLLQGVKEAFSFGGSSEEEPQELPSDTLSGAYTSKVTYTIQ